MSDWHVPDELLEAFATAPGSIDAVTAASIEQHMVGCGSCQSVVGARSSSSELDAIWAEVADRVDRAGASWSERLLSRLGLESGPARLISATPALRMGAVAAVGLIVLAVVLVSRAADVGAAFLVVAPVVPTALVAMSFAPGADPAGECGLATPVFGFGLVMRRALLVELVAVAALGVGSLFIPIDGMRAVAWVLPALALSLGTLAGAVRWPATESATVVLACWAGAVVVGAIAEPGNEIVESVVFDPAGQLTVALLAAAAGVVVLMHRQALVQEAGR